MTDIGAVEEESPVRKQPAGPEVGKGTSGSAGSFSPRAGELLP